MSADPPSFESAEFQAALRELFAWRRDVRSFRTDPVPQASLNELLQAAALAPSVGLSQPWRFVRVRSITARAAVRASFEACNAQALAGYDGEDAALYARLKLAGLDDAPEQYAVFCDHGAAAGRGLGRQTMPQALDYSVVAAINTLWLAARAKGVGLGWVSILDPAVVTQALDVPPSWRLIAYLCLGWPQAHSLEPELQRLGWERRSETTPVLER
ncbi:MAG: 5,6-dimethylbenzimidazole synthase [Caulobacteraceae bacterium]